MEYRPQILKKDIKNMYLSVSPDCSVVLKVPKNTPEEYINNYLKEKENWIYKQITKFKQHREYMEDHEEKKEYISGECFMYLGKQYRLKIHQSAKEYVELNGNYINVHVKDKNNIQKKKKLVEQWYKEKALYLFLKIRDEHYKRITDNKPELAIRKMKKRWGSCLYDKNKNIIILRRDVFGVKPLFYIDRDKYFAFASEKKALWSLLMKIDGMSFEEAYNYPVSRLNPNSQLIYDLNENECEVEENLQRIRTDYFENNYNTNLDYETCKKELEEALWDSISKRTRGIDKIGIIYSGGVDSTLIAKMASEYSEVILYTVGTEESEDIKYAESASKDMGLKFRKKIISPEEYEKYLLNVAYAIDEIDLMKLAVGIPIYVASEMAKEDGIKVVLSGQGADELFGGYNRYGKILSEKGKEGLKESYTTM